MSELVKKIPADSFINLMNSTGSINYKFYFILLHFALHQTVLSIPVSPVSWLPLIELSSILCHTAINRSEYNMLTFFPAYFCNFDLFPTFMPNYIFFLMLIFKFLIISLVTTGKKVAIIIHAKLILI